MSIGAALVAIIGYLIKSYVDKAFDRINKTAEQLRTTSLAMKGELRREERSELVTFRVAVEKWQNFLETSVFDFAMAAPAKADVAELYKSDKELFLDVKVAVVKASTYLRDEVLEVELMAAVDRIRKTYYPIINEHMPKLIDLQTSLIPIQTKLSKFAEGDMKDMSFAPTQQDLDDSRALQAQLTEELRAFAETVTTRYEEVAEQLADLKQSINRYIYRPVTEARVDTD